jgi:hypothetical protein
LHIADWCIGLDVNRVHSSRFHFAPFLTLLPSAVRVSVAEKRSDWGPGALEVAKGCAFWEPSPGEWVLFPAGEEEESPLVLALLIKAAREGALVFHSSAVLFRERALLIAGVSGAGKSTLATLLADCAFLSDEFNVVKTGSAGLTVSSTPLRSSSPRLPNNLTAPLGAILFPVKDTRDFLVALSPSEALPMLVAHAVTPGFPGLKPPFPLLAEMARTVPTFEFHFRKDPACRALLDELPL